MAFSLNRPDGIDESMSVQSQYNHFCVAWTVGQFTSFEMENMATLADESTEVMGLPKIMQRFVFCIMYPATKRLKIDFVKQHFEDLKHSPSNVLREIDENVRKSTPARRPVEPVVPRRDPTVIEMDGDASANPFRMPDVVLPSVRSVGTVTGEEIVTIGETRQRINERCDNEVFPSLSAVAPNPRLPRPNFIPNLPRRRHYIEVPDRPFYPTVNQNPSRDDRYPLRDDRDEFMPPSWENPIERGGEHGFFTTDHVVRSFGPGKYMNYY